MDYCKSNEEIPFPRLAANCKYGDPYDDECDNCATNNLASTMECYHQGIRIEWGKYWKPNFVIYDSNVDIDKFIK